MRKKLLIKGFAPYFRSESETKLYVESNLRRKKRNLIARRIRMTRKANSQFFNYLVMFSGKKMKSSLKHELTGFNGKEKCKKKIDITIDGGARKMNLQNVFTKEALAEKYQKDGSITGIFGMIQSELSFVFLKSEGETP